MKKLVLYLLASLIMLIFFKSAYAWNAMGHRIIGEIAYGHLTPQSKIKVDQLINYLSDAYPYSSNFQTANGWADTIKQDGAHTFDSWHFYNQPYSIDNTPVIPPATENLVWAINQSYNILQNPKTNQFEKAFFLRFLLHFVGDAHQPLHCINRFSKNFPAGDRGGNLFITHNKNYDNLHAYWDDGLGLFDERCGFSSSKSKRAKCFAEKFQKTYPINYFGDKSNNLNPEDWTQESFIIAKNSVYQTPENQPVSQTYINNNQEIIEQQITLAGYRLANSLNKLLG
jgi:hypothetical protein